MKRVRTHKKQSVASYSIGRRLESQLGDWLLIQASGFTQSLQ